MAESFVKVNRSKHSTGRIKAPLEITIRPASMDDAVILARTMRDMDVLELLAGGTSPASALADSLMASTQAWTAECDKGIICMWGVAPLCVTTGVGSVWLLGSDLVKTVKKRFLLETLRYVDEMRKTFPVLMNVVMVGNDVSQRWLRWAGAKFQPPVKINGVWFQPFTIGK